MYKRESLGEGERARWHCSVRSDPAAYAVVYANVYCRSGLWMELSSASLEDIFHLLSGPSSACCCVWWLYSPQ